MITADQMLALAPGADVPLVDALAPAYALLLPVWQIDTPLRVAHFVAQTCLETDHFRTLREYGGSQARYAPYFGRGCIQLTWDTNYAKAGQALGLPLLAKPDLVATPALGAIVACMYWSEHNLNRWADADDAASVSRAINRGSASSDKPANHEAERIALTAKAKAIWGATAPSIGSRSTVALQRALNRLGAAPKLATDGALGPLTAEAVRQFQAAHGLVTDGNAGPKTWAAVDDAIAELEA
ncbi:peptidoglycan-binding protein [Inquilinus limosus]|nr:peptidoglycan-binding protein [Inquilinus limosus]